MHLIIFFLLQSSKTFSRKEYDDKPVDAPYKEFSLIDLIQLRLNDFRLKSNAQCLMPLLIKTKLMMTKLMTMLEMVAFSTPKL